MSYFGGWTCPVCGSTWMGSIGWTWPENLDDFLEKICGCTGKQITEEDMGNALTISVMSRESD